MSHAVLIVDDLAVFCEPIAAMLRDDGYEVRRAEHGQQALDMLADWRPRLILLDLAMPVMDGITFLEHIRNDPDYAGIPVIVFTAVSETRHREAAERLGVEAYLLKSRFSLRELRARVEQVVEQSDQGESADTPVEALAALQPLTTREKILADLEAFEQVRAISPVVEQVLSLTADPHCDMGEVAGAISMDSALAVRVLKMANSVIYHRGQPVDTIRNAVMRLGLRQIRQIALTIDIIDRFAITGLGEHMTHQTFWEHALATGLIASELSRHRSDNVGQAEVLFAAGLLHDVGRLMLADLFSHTYGEVLQHANALRLPLHQVESKLLGISHTEVAERVLTAWDFPPTLVSPIRQHHLPADRIATLDDAEREDLAMVALANRLAHAMLLGSSGNHIIEPIRTLCEILKLTADQIRRIRDRVGPLLREVKTQIIQGGSTEAEPPARLTDRLIGPVHAQMITTQPDHDVATCLFESLRKATGRPANSPHNLIVVVPSVDDSHQFLCEMLLEVEQHMKTSPLPVLILNFSRSDAFDTEPLGDRDIRQLTGPMHLSTLLDSVNELIDPAAAKRQADKG